ncbi:MAG TPA: hypothetical protein VHW24_28570 [Bryobacteraceae bacterium]|nr:hypothetical protein [Bryobacteraceae bacterium]
MKQLKNEIILMPTLQRTLDQLLASLAAGDIFVLKAAAGSGRTTVLRRLHAQAGGVFIGIRDVIHSLAGRDPFSLEEAFLSTIERALDGNNLVIVDDLHLVSNVVNNFRAVRQHLLDAALTSIMGDAAAWGKKLVFGVENEIPWPVRRRAHVSEIETLSREDFECILRELLQERGQKSVDARQIQRFAPKLTA